MQFLGDYMRPEVWPMVAPGSNGARIGAGTAMLTSGESVNILAGTLIETTLTSPLLILKT